MRSFFPTLFLPTGPAIQIVPSGSYDHEKQELGPEGTMPRSSLLGSFPSEQKQAPENRKGNHTVPGGAAFLWPSLPLAVTHTHIGQGRTNKAALAIRCPCFPSYGSKAHSPIREIFGKALQLPGAPHA